jgi:hypothetical protein
MTKAGLPFLWLYGPSGVGKSTIAWEIHRLLGASGVDGAFVDADQLGLCYPAGDGDPDNHRIKAANLAAASQGFGAAGAPAGRFCRSVSCGAATWWSTWRRRFKRPRCWTAVN